MAERSEQLAQASGRRIPVFLKIAPDLDTEPIEVIAPTMLRYGADTAGTPNQTLGVIATNTTLSCEAGTGLPHATEGRGLSGAPVLESSNAVVRQLRQQLDPRFPIIGVGGILSAVDAVDKIDAGADVVQIYTGPIYQGPALVRAAAEAIRAHRNA